jgi:Cu-Zn family superoxide dismutase
MEHRRVHDGKARRRVAPLAAAAGVAFAAAGAAQTTQPTGTTAPQGKGAATVELADAKGRTLGRAQLTGTPHGVLVSLTVEGAQPGTYAFHIHETGRCDAPSFESAGEHFNPSRAKHGFMDAQGPHAGDMPNVHVPSGGRATVEHMARGASLDSGASGMFDGDGAALVLHAKPDDYRSDPAGNAGARVACGVIRRR